MVEVSVDTETLEQKADVEAMFDVPTSVTKNVDEFDV